MLKQFVIVFLSNFLINFFNSCLVGGITSKLVRAMEIMHKNIMDVTPEELQFVKDYGLIK